LEQIIDEEENGNNINQATGLKRHLEDELFLFWLNFFHQIMPNVDIFFKQLQMRNIDVILVKNYIMSFNSNIQKVRSAILKAEDSKRLISLKICDIIMSEIGHRFGFNDHLMISQLFQAEKFEAYTTNFLQNI
jgi:hypothetical protein